MPTKPTTEPPVLDPVVLASGLTVGDRYDLEDDADLEGFAFADLDLDVLALRDASVLGSRFDAVRADEAELRGVTLTEVVLDRLDVPVLRGVRGRWRDVEVRGARLGSAEVYESTWDGVHLVGCKLGYVNLRGASLQDVAFTDCTIDELDLVQARATRVAFAGTRVRRLDVQASTLAHVDLRGADLDDLAGVGSLRGATIGPEQLARLAGLLADDLGIVVAEGTA
ncbi:pentapeptide repeat-containing protein [Cellulosimicrobium marinum]|uniref:pentapeptide repeat-containing protein n=1 Tax=Cellulosimicrobium marinum TaxID=1638992 RepID=UPI001E47EDC6|nr:pentapeptide repeat-containing protein [Cellulosimicrobium marinum]MCB7135833.1 pentapeptide repeat-containing protein [Cellulosimicrobium marinum]